MNSGPVLFARSSRMRTCELNRHLGDCWRICIEQPNIPHHKILKQLCFLLRQSTYMPCTRQAALPSHWYLNPFWQWELSELVGGWLKILRPCGGWLQRCRIAGSAEKSEKQRLPLLSDKIRKRPICTFLLPSSLHHIPFNCIGTMEWINWWMHISNAKQCRHTLKNSRKTNFVATKDSIRIILQSFPRALVISFL